MAQASWPSPAHNARAVTDPEYEKIAARFSDDGIDGTPLDPAVVTAGPGLSVTVRANAFGSLRGHAWTSGTSSVNLPVAANASGSTRVDRVVLRLDRATWTARSVIRQGTPGAGAPALVRDLGDTGLYEIPLAVVTIPSGASTVGVSGGPQYIGSRIRPANDGAAPPPALGEMQFRPNTGQWRGYDGSGFVTIYENSGSVVITGSATPWTVRTEPVLHVRDGVAHLRLGSIERTGGTLTAPEDSRLPAVIPAAFRHPSREQYAGAYVEGARAGRITIYPANHARAGEVWLTQHPEITHGQYVLAYNTDWVFD